MSTVQFLLILCIELAAKEGGLAKTADCHLMYNCKQTCGPGEVRDNKYKEEKQCG